MKYYILTYSIVILIFCSCRDDSLNGISKDGKFVVESFTATSTSGLDSSYISCEIKYHYENWSGTINEPIFIVGIDTIRAKREAAYYEPEEVNITLIKNSNFWLSKYITSQDSVYVTFFIYGSFWTRINRDSTYHYGQIFARDSTRIIALN